MRGRLYNYEVRRPGKKAFLLGDSLRKNHIESECVSSSRRLFSAGAREGARLVWKSEKGADSATAAIAHIAARPSAPKASVGRKYDGPNAAVGPRHLNISQFSGLFTPDWVDIVDSRALILRPPPL